MGGRDLMTRSDLVALVELLHPAPIAVVLAAAGAFSAAAAGGWPPWDRLLPFLIALLLTQLGISLHNDYCDRDLDRRVKPWRAIPRGLVSARAALGGAIALFASGVAVAAVLGALPAALVAVGSATGLAYNAWFKRSAWTVVPFGVALPTLPICSFVVVGKFRPRLLLAYVVGAPLVLAVYLADTLADVEVDRNHGVRGFAHRLGPPPEVVCVGSALLGVGLATVSAPRGRRPAPLFLLALGSVGVAALALRLGRRDASWSAIMVAVVATAVAWFAV
jgi:4-hydroxybenzoate polyprenyltransferase